MHHESENTLLKKRRGVSNIIGSLIVLAIVASVGSVILFQGLNQINEFNYDLTLFDKERVNELREDLIFEHIRFDPSSTTIELFIANIGTVDTTISTITIVKLDTQELIVAREAPSPSEATIPIEDHTILTLAPTLSPAPNDKWNSTYYNTSSYKITVGTVKGNFLEKTVEPYNT